MKKFSVLFVAFAYLSLFNYCVTYAVVTGEAHHPSPSPLSAASSDHEAAQHDHDHHDHGAQSGHASSSHEHGSSEESEEACCVKLTEGLHVLLPAAVAIAELSSATAPLDALISRDISTLSPTLLSLRDDRGPPGSVAQDGFFASRSSRAPPYLPSL